MDQATSRESSSSAPLTLSKAAVNFLAKHQDRLQSMHESLFEEIKTLNAQLDECTTLGLLLASDLPDGLAAAAACDKEAAEELGLIMQEFDKEVGGAGERGVVEEALRMKFTSIQLGRSMVRVKKEAIAQVLARHG